MIYGPLSFNLLVDGKMHNLEVFVGMCRDRGLILLRVARERLSISVKVRNILRMCLDVVEGGGDCVEMAN